MTKWGQKVAPPPGLSFEEIEVGGELLYVLSYPIEGSNDVHRLNLSKSEFEVARLAAQGLTNKEIADARGSALRTVANQMASILRKLGLGSRAEVSVLFAKRSF